MSSPDIPVIAIDAFRTRGPEAAAVSAAVKSACETIGFFVITGHGVPGVAIDALLAEARLFFDRPAPEKSRIAAQGTRFGGPTYVPLRAESLAATLGPKGGADVKECLDAGPRFQGDCWPEDCAALEQAWNAAFDALSDLAAVLRALFADAMGLDANGLEPAFARHCSSMRTLNYPAVEAPLAAGEQRAGAHTDYGAFTILRGDDAPGLQVQRLDGSWIDAPVIPGSFVINIGDALMRWTNDHWRSTPHRVIVPSAAGASRRRQSIAYFHNPSADAVIECLPPFLPASGCGGYPPIRYQAYAEQKFQQSRGSTAALILDAGA